MTNENQKENVKGVVQPEMPPARIEWAYWLLGILAGSLTGYAIGISGGEILVVAFMGSIIGGAVGGWLVGFMPNFAKRWKISRVGWWTWIFVDLVLIVIAILIIQFFVYTNKGFYYLLEDTVYNHPIELPLGIITGFVVAIFSRGICRGWKTSQNHKWKWVMAKSLLVVTIIITCLFAIFLAMFCC